jgi:propionyl-CoA carboxylase alpha chain
MQHPAFVSGNFDTKFIDKYFNPELLQPVSADGLIVALASGVMYQDQSSDLQPKSSINAEEGNWKRNRKAY